VVAEVHQQPQQRDEDGNGRVGRVEGAVAQGQFALVVAILVLFRLGLINTQSEQQIRRRGGVPAGRPSAEWLDEPAEVESPQKEPV